VPFAGTDPTRLAQPESENKFNVPVEHVVATAQPVHAEQLSVMSSSPWYARRVNGAGQARFPMCATQAENPAGAVPLHTELLLDEGTSQ
jgi:hypothetical protein